MATDLKTTINQNMPGILTAGSIVTQIATAGLAFYEGMKFKEDLDKLPEDATTKTKILTVIRRVAPVVLGVTAGTTMSYAAYAESTKRIAALSAAVAAARADRDSLKEFKNKAKEMIGEDKVKEVDEELVKEDLKMYEFVGGDADEKIKVHDLETGAILHSTLRDIHKAIRVFNEENDTEAVPISMFYQEADNDYKVVPVHEDIYAFDGFYPNISYEKGPNMEPVMTLEWTHTNDVGDTRSSVKSKMRNQCHNYSY